MSRKELRQPDQVQVALAGWWDRLEQHWRLLAAGALALLVAGVGSSVYKRSAAADLQSRAEVLRNAMEPLTAPTGEMEADAPDYVKSIERFDDRAAARSAALERLNAVNTDGDASVQPIANLLRGVLTPTDDANGSTALADASSSDALAPLHTSIQFALAQRQAGSGDTAAAAKTYEALAAQSTGVTKAMALMAQGDLHNPLVVEGGDGAKAKSLYEGAQEALGPRPPIDPSDIFATLSEPYIYGALERKLALLN
jgi:hypothetical protein